MKRIWELWKEKWGIKTNARMTWIFIMFAITGSSTVVVRKFLFQALGIEIENAAIAFVVKFVAIYFVYQAMLFVIGTLMGEHKFVKWFLLKMNSSLLGRRGKSSPPP
ncbi:MAG: DUF6787 family protein [Bacteroidota bacterium]